MHREAQCGKGINMTKPKENWEIQDINGLSDYQLLKWVMWTLRKRYGKSRAKRILKIIHA